MVNKYRNANKDLKEYKASRVKTGTSKNGAKYTVFQIADKIKKADGTNAFDNYSIFTWQDDINLNENDKIAIVDITGLEVKQSEYNGKTYYNLECDFVSIMRSAAAAAPAAPGAPFAGSSSDPGFMDALADADESDLPF